MINREKLTEATILEMKRKMSENKIKIHFIDDYIYDNKEDAIEEFGNRVADLQADGLEELSKLAQEVVDRLDNDEINIVIDDDEINQANSQDEEYDISNELNYDNSNVFYRYYKYYDSYGVGNIYFGPTEYEGKLLKKSVRPKVLVPEYEVIKEFPDYSKISKLILDGNLVVISNDYAIGRVVDIVATYVQYRYDRTDAYVNYYNFNRKIKSLLNNMKENVSNEIAYVGTDLTSKIFYGQEAISHFKSIYDKWVNSNVGELNIYYM